MKDFQRNFLIFVGEDTGYGMAEKPSGHVKIEVREGRGKLRASVQNLLESDNYYYKLYLVDTLSGRSEAVPAGLMELKRNKAELEWDFDPLNVGGSGLPIRNFEVAALLVEYPDRGQLSVICPLAAYRNGKKPWRNGLAERLYINKGQEAVMPKVEYTSKYEISAQSKYIPPETQPGFNMIQHDSDNIIQHGSDAMPHSAQKPDAGDGDSYDDRSDTDESSIRYEAAEETAQETTDDGLNEEQTQHEWQVEQDVNKEQQLADNTGLNTNCVYLNSNMCGAYINTAQTNPCQSCAMYDLHQKSENRSAAGNMQKLRFELDNYFEKFDPFHVKRSDYTWWKVANPVNLNNILYQCNIRSPLLFNPAVMLSHYKYRHLIVGIFTDRTRQKEFVVCGVFGMHMVDRKPFGDMCKWVPTESSRPKYGAFGYWIVYLDPETGRILNLK